MIGELKKFVFTFSLLIIGIMVATSQLKLELLVEEQVSFYQTALYIFDSINGNSDFEKYKYPQGKIFIAMFSFLFNILLLSFLVSMFINKYKSVFNNIDALRRMNIIKLKNSSSYDEKIGGATLTFFPINIILIIPLPFVVLFKSERLSDFVLKVQYTFMIIIFCAIALVLAVPIFPLLYLKCIGNAIYISAKNKRVDYPLQNEVNLLLTVLLNPILILISLLVDLFNLVNLLMKDERGFEFKY